MIEWLWVPVAVTVVWLVLLAGAAWRDDEILEAVKLVGCAVAAIPLLPLVWIAARMDTGAVPIDARALERFARMRTVDKRPAWVFLVRHRGVILLRRWDVGTARRLSPIEVVPVTKTDGQAIKFNVEGTKNGR